MGIRAGIDLGTTYSAIAYVDETGRPKIIKNKNGKNITPSVLSFHDNHTYYGEDAKELQLDGDTNTIAFFKRLMGDPLFAVTFHGKSYNAEALSAILLKNIINDAEEQISQKITDVVITVPAYFKNHQREATIRAGQKAGVNVLCLINEPTSAAFAYGLNKQDKDMTVLVYDLGGGTFDVTLVKVTRDTIIVLGSSGDYELGGKNWDNSIARYLETCFIEEHGQGISDKIEDINELMAKIENAKRQLTSLVSTKITINSAGKKSTFEISRKKFEEISSHLMLQTQILTETLIEDVNHSSHGPLSWGQIDGTLLIGGSTRMPMVSDFIRRMTGKEPLRGVNVDEAVALGAAIRANIDLEGNSLDFLLSPSSSGDCNAAPHNLLPGAKAIQDVISHSLGMISANEENTKFINQIILRKNSPIPSTYTRPFLVSTRKGGEHEVEVYMLQGESEYPLDCSILGKYVFSGIEYIGKSKSILDITYNYTLNGTVEVSAVQRETGKPLILHIEPIPNDMSWVNKSPQELVIIDKKTEFITILLAIDLSGSMSGRPLMEAKKAAINLVHEMDLTCTDIGLIIFADRVKLNLKPNRDIETIIQGIQSWDVGLVGIGNDAEPFAQCLEILCTKKGFPILNRNNPEKHLKYVIVLTDGCWSNQGRAINNARKCHNAGIEVIAIGFGGADYNFLKQISSSDETALFTSLNDLSSSFSKIAQAITEHDSGSKFQLLK